MNYTVLILPRAEKQLRDLPKTKYVQARDAILELGGNPRPSGCKKLTAREGWRIRVGDYRVVYEINDSASTVTVLDIGHRRDIYR